jgi:hypothetical protein
LGRAIGQSLGIGSARQGQRIHELAQCGTGVLANAEGIAFSYWGNTHARWAVGKKRGFAQERAIRSDHVREASTGKCCLRSRNAGDRNRDRCRYAAEFELISHFNFLLKGSQFFKITARRFMLRLTTKAICFDLTVLVRLPLLRASRFS